eukprot:SAG31_NODE_28653_length_407_cov_0.571429_1_plen_91_part_00
MASVRFSRVNRHVFLITKHFFDYGTRTAVGVRHPKLSYQHRERASIIGALHARLVSSTCNFARDMVGSQVGWGLLAQLAQVIRAQSTAAV